ncbi:MAG: TrkA C-terminal domain-containing protein [Prochloraceae cyanobacterium]|nr:TrkA C-terminal domain-containing protein [Prochloraceae cyanobacterium]
MVVQIVDIVKNNPQLFTFILLAFAFWAGKIKLGSVVLGPQAGILVMGTVFGYFGFELPPMLGAFSFLLFLFAVAYEAGPGFFTVALPQFGKFATLSVVVVLIQLALAVGFSAIFDFNLGIGAGLFTGAGVNPPGIGAAINVVETGKIPMPDGLSVEQAIQFINVTYAITFLVSYLIAMQLLRKVPQLLKFELSASAKEAESATNPSDSSSEEGLWLQSLRAYRAVKEDILGKSVQEIQTLTHCKIDKIKRAGMLVDFELDTTLKKDDLISVGGHRLAEATLTEMIGPEVVDADLLGEEVLTREAIVTNPDIFGKSLGELRRYAYGCYLGQYTRSGVKLKIDPELRLARGDVLKITGTKAHLNQLVEKIGYAERDVNATDLLTFALGVSSGFILGLIEIQIGDISIGLGTASGVLLVGLAVGYMRSIKHSFGLVPPATIWVFKQLGLLLFLGDVGVKGGPRVVEALTNFGPLLILSAIAIGTLPLAIGYLVGERFFKMNKALLLGAVAACGSNTPGMLMLVEDAESSIPAVGYAGTYAITYIFKIIAATVIVYIGSYLFN